MAAQPTGEKPFKPMNKKNLAYFEKRLLEERRRVLKELGHYDETFGNTPQGADGDLSAYSFHMADQGTDAMEREKAFLFASQEGRFLWHIDDALRRLYKTPEIYGRCHSCKGEIAFERLDALPPRGCRHPPRAARQSGGSGSRDRHPRRRPLHQLAALVSRHGPRRLLPVADR